MTQTKTQSLTETAVSITVGFILSYLVGWFVFPLFGFNVSPNQNVSIVLIFTLTSFSRSYLLRRFFNYFNNRKPYEYS